MESRSASPEAIPPAVLPGLNIIGWVPPVPDLSIEHWERTLSGLAKLEQATPWALGDMWIYAESRGKEYAERAMQIIAEERAEQTVRNYAVVCRVFPRTMRRCGPGMSIKHHRAVIVLARESMEEAQRWLEVAERDEMSAATLYKAANPDTETAQISTQTEKTEADIAWQGPMLAKAAALIMYLSTVFDGMGALGAAAKCRDWLTRYNQHMSGDAAK